MIEIVLVNGGKGVCSAAIILGSKFDRRVCAAAEVSGAGANLGGGGGVAGVLWTYVRISESRCS